MSDTGMPALRALDEAAPLVEWAVKRGSMPQAEMVVTIHLRMESLPTGLWGFMKLRKSPFVSDSLKGRVLSK